MADPDAGILRSELLARRMRLRTAVRSAPGLPDATRLLAEVDAALARMETGSYGLCEVCHAPIEPERLLSDPLVRVCLAHLNDRERSALERDLDLARRIQGRLLPPRSIHAAGWQTAYHYRPAATVSGDYCDVLALDPDGVFFVTADVSGKGVAASLLMSHLHAIVHTLLTVGAPVASLLAQANRLFCESILPSHFATAVCGVARADGTVTLANAGHWPPLVVRRHQVDALEPTGLPLGFTCSTTYGERSAQLAAGDALVLYTDGLTEARIETDTEYGRDRLAGVLGRQHGAPADAIAAAVLDDLATFLTSVPLTDDLTLLVLSRSA